LFTVSAIGQQTEVEQISAATDSNGKLYFQFSNVPDITTTPFLMVEIMDTVGGQQEVVRQTLVPAPTVGQQMGMGVSELSSRQTQIALQAMQAGHNQALDAMFPLLMIPTGAMDAADAPHFGQAASDAATTFHDYLRQNGVTATQMTNFQNGLLNAMREFATANQDALDQTNPGTIAGLYGQAGAWFMEALIQAGATAGINPGLMSAAFDQAGQSIDNSAALDTLPVGEIDAMQATFRVDAQQRRLLAQMRGFASAMPLVVANTDQTLTFTTAMNTLQSAMALARQNFYQQAFADSENLPDSNTIDQALSTMATAMENAFNAFDQATTATNVQINSMLGIMANNMNGHGGMMGGGMMSGAFLGRTGFGMMQTTLDGTSQNWSTMMVGASNLVSTVPGMTYTPVTDDLTAQLTAENRPSAPDWSQLPDGPDKNLLQLQYDLMLVNLIDQQIVAGLALPLTQADLAAISAQDLDNRAAIRQGLQGLSDTRMDALMAALNQPWLCPLY
jgi:hypothetical protein